MFLKKGAGRGGREGEGRVRGKKMYQKALQRQNKQRNKVLKANTDYVVIV